MSFQGNKIVITGGETNLVNALGGRPEAEFLLEPIRLARHRRSR